MDGGYDSGYRACPCFWGTEPGKLVRAIVDSVPTLSGTRILDVGCGEGKNAFFFAQHGASVTAIDISELAIDHAKQLWPESPLIEWRISDVRMFELDPGGYDFVVAYGLLHCLGSVEEIKQFVGRLQGSTRPGGYHAIVALNSRHQDLRVAHPELNPCLLSHEAYLEQYTTWQVLFEEDANLCETHPHNLVPHTHSLTRILARKPKT
jgi:2-polyprenyl-3-methyl-5-hydroxy-6-metoxy-1,4-benzoquinol methylase